MIKKHHFVSLLIHFRPGDTMTISLHEYQANRWEKQNESLHKIRDTYVRIPYIILLSFVIIGAIAVGIMFTENNVVVMAVILSIVVGETVLLFVMLLSLLPISSMKELLHDFLIRNPNSRVPIQNFSNINVEELELYDFQNLSYRR